MRTISKFILLGVVSGVLASAPVLQAQEENQPARDDTPGFVFGSYGRVRAASDLEGHSGSSTNIVSHGTRYDLGNYAELEFRREERPQELEVSVVATIATSGEFFHYDATFEDSFAVRNFYAEVRGALHEGLALWAGSRMVRGDDIYLLDFWPLDNLNLIGGGASYATGSLELKLHGGLARPNDPFYVQRIEAPAPRGFEPWTVELLERPRAVVGFKGTWWTLGRTATRGLKLIGYGEAHHLPEGVRQLDVGTREALPATSGGAFGLQLGGWLDEPKAFSNLFFRCSLGLAAYDPLDAPELIGRLPPTDDASSCQVALSGNLEMGPFALQAGAYYRRSRDPSANVRTGGLVDEAAIDVRPHVYFGERAGLALDASYQAIEARTLDDVTGEVVGGSIAKLAVIPFYSPNGRGTYTRPHLQLVYALSLRDERAQRLYPELDRRSRSSLEHYFAIGAEWWFDSSSY